MFKVWSFTVRGVDVEVGLGMFWLFGIGLLDDNEVAMACGPVLVSING